MMMMVVSVGGDADGEDDETNVESSLRMSYKNQEASRSKM